MEKPAPAEATIPTPTDEPIQATIVAIPAPNNASATPYEGAAEAVVVTASVAACANVDTGASKLPKKRREENFIKNRKEIKTN